MTTRFSLQLNPKGIEEILKHDLREMVDSATEEIADRVRASVKPGVEVTTRSYTTDRAGGAVVIEDVRGMAYQARDGVLTRAAKGIGADFKPPKKRRGA